ncbi:oxidative stress-induced growth inhibitor 1-like [Cotesia glomerata]|uniref:Oxidative stress-induced growth inhibitor 1 n=1 Tax=Cotesia glomerata TaxID=32391 RepID=A0AAV7J3W3_COTGL|nr:oxidative stress-induced growth inhibitor 1-like [Cotesia glomerata]XP_044599234.1 oxidative stress-induced growth inhibitor 1-like [Cotesia glomerata]XP_044599235.1 oxidative stress-induced growth inhibitor 1-like [Cotesia glomerata]XP_044599236.1 oxidative stress-induced growth inhibitor 1-like [Cotesia glomerata]XP_044599237.1 oxidative stress-induced growth inhibitor 1-like [Cotesia glomerata]XP_044599238.1 oxidative stress-induced growth inhibitor 1-like [Cotesia glomerata]XP_04459923
MQQLSNALEETVYYKDVVIVGNGPGAMFLSFMLNGNWPYYTGGSHPGDEMLTARLHYILDNANKVMTHNIEIKKEDETRENLLMYKDEDKKTGKSNSGIQTQIEIENTERKSLLECTREELEILATGVEGRGTCRPLALLMDQLQHPCVDSGLNLPGLITWKSAEHCSRQKIVNHVVLGKGPPGGAWQFMDPNVLTISLSRWMSLPGLDFQKWERLVGAEQLHKISISLQDARLSAEPNFDTLDAMKRIPVGIVAAYYKEYVKKQGLAKYFKTGRTITSVRPILDTTNTEDSYGWVVKGYDNLSGRKFRYKCKKVVLASGSTNTFNRLGLAGEETQSSWVTHDLNDLETRLDRLAGKCKKCGARENQDLSKIDPVLVVGAGLSAADAIITARCRGIPVIHAFRESSDASSDESESGVKLSANVYERLQTLPISMYPEYHKIYEMMADGRNHRLYKSLAGYKLVDLGVKSNDSNKTKERRVTLRSPSGQLFTFRVSIVAILIGSKPDLSYLGDYANKLGKVEDKPISGRSNPILVDDFTYQVIKSPREGLYAIGSLVGDNFVRFILGGAFGVASHILRTIDTE